MNPYWAFPIFVIFLFCQYAIYLVSNWIAILSNATGRTYWAIVVVAFLILNEFCFGGVIGEIDISDDERDEEELWRTSED